MKKYWLKLFVLAAVMTSLPVYASVSVKEESGSEGKRVVIAENDFFKMTVNPSRGGRVSSFIWKVTGADWVLPGNTGFFMDHVWQQTWPGELLEKEYEVKILEKGPERVVIQAVVTINGKGDKAIEGVRLIRTMEIFKDSPRIEVAFRLENPTSEPRAPGLWVQNCIHVGGKATEAVWTYRPSRRGVIAASLDPKTGKAIGNEHSFIYDPVAGWSAEVNPAGKEGMVFLTDYNWLRCLYNNDGSQSVEWWYDQESLGAGKSFETKVIMWPFAGLTGVTYASPELVADLNITVTGKELLLANRLVAGPRPEGQPLAVTLELIAYDTGQTVSSREFSDIALTSTAVAQDLVVKDEPTTKNLLGRATVKGNAGKEHIYETYRPAAAVLGTEKPYQTPRPERNQPVERPTVIAKTPHKGMRILHLRGLFHYYYRLDETAKALGAEFKHGSYRTFVYGPSLSYFPSDYGELMGYDIIVLSNIPMESMDHRVRQYLTDFVEHGGAVLVIGGHWAFGGGGYKNTWLEELLPVTTRGPFDVAPVQGGYISPQPGGEKGIGTLWIQDLTPKPGAEVKILAGGKPFWIEWKRGQGMAAVMAGVCYGEAPKDMILFWEWDGWPQWLAQQIKRLMEQTGGNVKQQTKGN